MMIEKIVALLGAPLWLAAPKKKASKVKRGRPPARSAVKRAPVKPRRKQQLAAAAPPAPPVAAEEVETVTEPAPPPPPPVAPVQAPQLFYPATGEAVDSLTPNFRWFYVGGASHYQLVWSPDVHFHKAHILLTTQTAAVLPPEQALEPNTTFVWRVRGGNEGGWGPWSPSWSFRTPGT